LNRKKKDNQRNPTILILDKGQIDIEAVASITSDNRPYRPRSVTLGMHANHGKSTCDENAIPLIRSVGSCDKRQSLEFNPRERCLDEKSELFDRSSSKLGENEGALGALFQVQLCAYHSAFSIG